MAAEVDIVAEAEDLQSFWAPRDHQIHEDRRILSLSRLHAVTDRYDVVSNEPKVFYETALALLTSFPRKFRLPLTIDFKPDEENKMAKAERFLLGIFRELDRRQRRTGGTFWERDFTYWVLSGWYAVFKLVRRAGNSVEFLADIWDPVTVYPEWSADKLTKVARIVQVDGKTARTLMHDWQLKDKRLQDLLDPKLNSFFRIINY